ncbi:hypothetical protein RI129_004734 [Pyrocoelia pectoralis]|uniref:Reelin domain-containing protein n=1 Tax=Pyrocoelia pectoralis TaxID=417401 RepID=A0AAN7VCX2_9COLE
MVKKILVVFLMSIISIYGYSTGAPKEACPDMKPQHPFDPQSANEFPYNVTVSKTNVNQGGKVLITISGWKVKHFKGFLVQVRDNKDAVGSFSIPPSYGLAQTLDCGSTNSAATHTSSDLKDTVELEWIAPFKYTGKLTLFTTVAKDGEVFWSKQKAIDIQVL